MALSLRARIGVRLKRLAACSHVGDTWIEEEEEEEEGEDVCLEGFCIITRLSDSLEASTVNDARNLALVLLEDLLERCPVPDIYVVPE